MANENPQDQLVEYNWIGKKNGVIANEFRNRGINPVLRDDSHLPKGYGRYSVKVSQKVCDEVRYAAFDQGESGYDASEFSECFVAAAVYGNRNAPEVRVLRDFRDNILKENVLGQLLVDIYYSGAGRRVARFVSDFTPSLIPTIRKGLDHIVEWYSNR